MTALGFSPPGYEAAPDGATLFTQYKGIRWLERTFVVPDSARAAFEARLRQVREQGLFVSIVFFVAAMERSLFVLLAFPVVIGLLNRWAVAQLQRHRPGSPHERGS